MIENSAASPGLASTKCVTCYVMYVCTMYIIHIYIYIFIYLYIFVRVFLCMICSALFCSAFLNADKLASQMGTLFIFAASTLASCLLLMAWLSIYIHTLIYIYIWVCEYVPQRVSLQIFVLFKALHTKAFIRFCV